MPDAPKGLATVAFLKTRLDEGCDHLGLFEPLVLDALGHIATPDFLAEDIKALVHDRTGLLLPANAVQMLLGRCARRGLVQREGGRFFRTSKPIPGSRLESARTAIQVEQDSLSRALAQFAAQQGVHIESSAEALEALATFLSDNKVQVILDELLPDSPLERSSLDRKLTRVIARFVTVQCLESPELRQALAGLTEGIVIQDTLLMRDIPEAAQRFRDLVVVMDTPVLLAAIDLMGVANAVATKEGLALLRQAGARTIAFRRTLDEMREILAVYEEHLGTTSGRLSLRPTALTQYVLTARSSPADIRVISSTLENRLAKIGVAIHDVPAHVPRYTLDEEALAKALVDVAQQHQDVPRIRHDVACVAGVLTLRAGRVSTSIERSVAIFCTTSGRVVRSVQQWFFTQDGQGIPPIVHQVALTSIAWLKMPAAAPNLKIHELAALCVAALRPTRETMTKFVETLRRLQADGSITDDETAAIVARNPWARWPATRDEKGSVAW